MVHSDGRSRRSLRPQAAVAVVAVAVAVLLCAPPKTVEALVLRFASPFARRRCGNMYRRGAAATGVATRSGALLRMAIVPPPPGGMPADDDDGGSAAAPASSSTKRVGINSRGAKMNEIDFTLAPSDVSLSRCYQPNGGKTSSTTVTTTGELGENDEEQRVKTLSLTRALNTASNRAVRRILLARSWPSAEALNLSLRTVLIQQQQLQQQQQYLRTDSDADSGSAVNGEEASAKCPLPRPILNILTKKQQPTANVNGGGAGPLSEEEWVEDQIAVFRASYGAVPRYSGAEAFLECVLSLATSGVESTRVAEVFAAGVYDGPYYRILSVIESVGAVLEEVKDEGGETTSRRIAPKLLDRDICLSVMDKITLAKERRQKGVSADIVNGAPAVAEGADTKEDRSVPYDAAARLAYEGSDRSIPFEDFKVTYESDTVALVIAKRKAREGEGESESERSGSDASIESSKESSVVEKKESKGRKRFLFFWQKEKVNGNQDIGGDEMKNIDTSDCLTEEGEDEVCEAKEEEEASAEEQEEEVPAAIRPEDLGGVLLSEFEPTMTRQLNVLSNIVQRTLTFGGDQELIVLAETLDADRPSFVRRWYPDSDDADSAESRPGAQYLYALVQLLRDCHAKGVVTTVDRPVPLSMSYENAYRRLTALLVESGSGYVRPAGGSGALVTPLPKTAKEELGRFASWESEVRKRTVETNVYPNDLVGSWKVEDLVGGSIIGSTTVTFKPAGDVVVAAPMQGLRWRLDPGPTHLDTCTFQVLSDDGAILQYKGFIDRGSRLEARFSKRSMTMRGGVSFLMRDVDAAGDGYWDDMLPINYQPGATRFVMSQILDGTASGSDLGSPFSRAKDGVGV